MQTRVNLSRAPRSQVTTALQAPHDGFTDESIITPWTAIGLAADVEHRLVSGLPKTSRSGARAQFFHSLPVSDGYQPGLAARLVVERGRDAWFQIGMERTYVCPGENTDALCIWIAPQQEQRAREPARRRLGIEVA